MERKVYEMNDDQKLWQLLMAGDTSVIETFYTKYYSSLLDWGSRYTTNQELVEDSIHDLFVNLYTNTNLQPIHNIHSYLLRSLRNILFDKMARNSKSQTIDEYFSLSIEDTDLERIFSDSDEELILSKKIKLTYDNLPKQQQQIIYMRYIKGLSHKEISAILGINLQSSMNLASRTLKALRANLEKIYFILF